MAESGSVVVIGGTAGLGLAVAEHYANLGRSVVVSSRDEQRARDAAQEIGGQTTGVAVDLAEPEGIADALKDLGPVHDLVLVAIERDYNSIREYDVAKATRLSTLKLVGYTEVVHSLLPRLDPDSSILLFGGLAKERPYPGSTTVTTVNAAVEGMVRTLALELAPIRVNAIHPSVVGDHREWESKPAEVLNRFIAQTPIGRLITTDEVVAATTFLLDHQAINGINLFVDGGWTIS